MKRFFIIFFGVCFFLFTCCTNLYASTPIKGRITNTKNGEAIAFASIYAREIGKSTVSDIDGNFTLSFDIKQKIHLQITCLGYQTKEVVLVPGTKQIHVSIEEQSMGLKEVVVSAQYRDKIGSKATIEQEALEYIQPTSLIDIFALLPGGKMGDTNMQNGGLVNSRQVGTDLSSSFGMGLTVNGIPQHNDGMRIQMSGVIGNYAADGEGNVRVNAGTDLRTISTDHIQSVTINRGISSAKEGNLSSGSIDVHVKQGASPLKVRTKFDPQNKLAYLGKGFYLSEKLGTLYAGFDIVRSQADISDARGAYHRITGQLNWNNQRRWWGKKVDMNVSGSYITSFSNNKTDELIESYHEKYNSHYQHATFSGKLKMTLNKAWIDDVELTASYDYTQDVLKHHKHVINRTVMPLQQSTEEGEHEGTYLPSTYDTYYEIDNRPLTIFSELNAHKYGLLNENWNYSILLGGSYNYTKNLGDGAVVDTNLPPFPSEEFIRPRKNSDIPALINQAGYLEAKLRYRRNMHEWNNSLGIREVMMMNLPDSYSLQHKMLFEPRLQTAYTLYHQAGRHEMSHTIRIGYGVENKLPSADYLYPDLVYHDYIALNAYFSDPSKRLLITNTKIQNPVNPQLEANRNVKMEVGYDMRWKGLELNLTAFHELMKGGIEYFTSYTPAHYTYYYQLKNQVDGRPKRDDFLAREMYTFMSLRQPANSAKTEKRGLEYRIHIPNISAIKSEIEINGAYYSTIYSSGVPVMYRPSVMVGDQMYPYVGIYDGFDKQYASSFNTNCWINTHLPKWKLIFTNFIQIVWFQESHLSTDVDEYPEHYMDTDGEIHPFDLTHDSQLQSLKRDFLSSRYNKTRQPVSLLWNLKATKEFNEHVKLSFFANNIVQISPKYKDGNQHTVRNWHKPFFGAELMISL